MSLIALVNVQGTVMHIGLNSSFIQHAASKGVAWTNLMCGIYAAGRDVNLDRFPLLGGI